MTKCNRCKEQIKGETAYFDTKPVCGSCFNRLRYALKEKLSLEKLAQKRLKRKLEVSKK